MTSIKDWVLSQILSGSLITSRPLSPSESFLSDEPANEEPRNNAHTRDSTSVPVSADTSSSSRYAHDNQAFRPRLPGDNPDDLDQRNSQPNISGNASLNNEVYDMNKSDALGNVEGLQITFLRLLHRFGMSHDNITVLKVLHRIHLASLIRTDKPNLKRASLRIDRARKIALEQELSGLPELDFSIKILVLGKTGVGKSSTINSIFNQTKAITDAFQPATDRIEEIFGTINGVKLSFIDTPGLLPSSPRNIKKNRKTLYSIKRFIRKSPPDIVLYFERLDVINNGYSDFPLLKLIGEIFGNAVWFNTFLVLTHASSSLPEGNDGYGVSYDSFVTYCSKLLQRYLHMAVSDKKLQNPVILVENHLDCVRNDSGDKILPNGQAWRSQFFLLCLCTKVLADVNGLLEFEDSINLGPLKSPRLPSLQHLLSSFMKHRSRLNVNVSGKELDEILVLGQDEDEVYDELPPIRTLTKGQFQKLSNIQRKQYLDELDYRETLYLKKQLREEFLQKKETLHIDEDPKPEPDLLPDMSLPPNFDPSSPVHRYRCLVSSDQWLTRPVLDPHGWDHDVGFDGVNLETATEIRKNVFGSLSGQLSKDKQDFSLQSECLAVIVTPSGTNYSIGMDVQSTGREFVPTLHTNLMLRNEKIRNITECCVSVTSIGDRCFTGVKLEDSILIGKTMKLSINGGRMEGGGKVGCGGTLEATIRGRDYPVRDEKIVLAMTLLSFDNETVLGGNIASYFRLTRRTKLNVNGNINGRSMGQIGLKVSSSDHMEIALIAVVSIMKGLLRRRINDVSSTEIE